MNNLIQFSPAILGLVVVLQAGLNRKITAIWGLPAAVVLNALVFLILAFVIFFLSTWKAEWFAFNLKSIVSPTVRSAFEFKNMSWWFVIPGMLGCMLVFGGPWAIGRWGAVHTFILIISAQLLASLMWDYYVEGQSVSMLRICGILLSWIGALIVCLS